MTASAAPSADPSAATPEPNRPSRRRLYLTLAGLLGGVLVLAVLWVLVTGLIARSRLTDVQGELPALRGAVSSGNLAKARQISAQIARQTGDAHQLTSGPAWWVAANLPGVGTPFRTGRVVAYQADRIGQHALPGVLRLGTGLFGARGGAGQFRLGPLVAAERGVGSAARTVDSADRAVARTDPSWLPLVSGARSSVLPHLRQLGGQLHAAHRALHLALPMLGQHGTRRYFIGFLNEAESRGLGGIPGAFAIVTADHGHLRFSHFGSDNELRRVRAHVHLDAQFRELYGQNDPAGVLQNSDLSPNFPDAARIWAGMWETKTGQHIDGALAIDPSALGYFLNVAGAARLPDGSRVTAGNVVALTQQTQYAKYGGTSRQANLARKDYLVRIAKAIGVRLLGAHRLYGLSRAAQRAVHERRLVVWSAHADEQDELRHFGLTGELRPGRRPFAGFVVNNAAGSKLDYYLQTSLRYRRSSCAAGAQTQVTITLRNNVPDYRLPPYVTTVLNGKPRNAKPGFNKLILTYYATPGSVFRSVRLDGTRQLLATAPEDGLESVRLLIELQPHQKRTLSLSISEPAAHGPVHVLRQPAVQPVTVDAAAPTCR